MMKKWLLVFGLMFGVSGFSQPETEMAAKVKNVKAFIETVDIENKLITVFVTEMAQFTLANLEIGNGSTFIRDKQNLRPEELRTGMEIKYSANYYPMARRTVIEQMEIEPIERAERQFRGRLDFVRDGFVYSDGNRIELKKGTKVEGKGGYDGKFDQFPKNAAGALTTIDGQFSSGIYKADKAIIKPDMMRYQDIIADTSNSKAYKTFYPNWLDKSKRKALLGQKLGKYGLNRNEELQDYIQNFGTKLVPPQYVVRNFMFIVVQEQEPIARVCANGIAFISTGMLLLIENEAQLAAILSHEIVHAIYEHAAETQRRVQLTEANKQTQKAANMQGQKTARKNESKLGKDVKKAGDAIGKYLPAANDLDKMTGSIFDNRLALYTISEEKQADRVGLTMMAEAGYSPLEAVAFWTLYYQNYEQPDLFNLEGTAEEANRKDEQDAKKKPAKNSKDKQKTDTQKIVIAGASATMRYVQANQATKARRTHPSFYERFEELNRAIEMYWSDPKITDRLEIREEEYRRVKNLVSQTMMQEAPAQTVKKGKNRKKA